MCIPCTSFSSLFFYVKPRAFVHEAAATPDSVEGVVHCGSHQQNYLDLNLTTCRNVPNYKIRLHFDTLMVGTSIRHGTFGLTISVQLDGSGSPLAADVTLDSKVPILQLEDVDPYLRAVECFGSSITLSFNDEGSKREAEKQWASLRIFVVISYHPGCNSIHQRRPH